MQDTDHMAQEQRRRLAQQVERFLGQNLPRPILDALGGDHVAIVDVGALELDGVANLYGDLYARHPCAVVGFEPQADEVRRENRGLGQRLTLPLALGSGAAVSFRRTRYPAASSTFAPNADLLRHFHALPEMLAVEEVSEMPTVRLDEVPEARGCDLLKLDVQGGELAVLEGASELLAETGVVVVEVEFSPLYAGQPLFGDVDAFLRAQGFEFIDFLDRGWGSYKAGLVGGLQSRLLWADAAYVKGLTGLRALAPAKLLRIFLACHLVLRNPGQAAFVLYVYDTVQGTNLQGEYLNALLASPWN